MHVCDNHEHRPVSHFPSSVRFPDTASNYIKDIKEN